MFAPPQPFHVGPTPALNAAAWLRVGSAERSLKLVADEAARTEAAARYKYLTDVEMAFRSSKTTHLEIRPFYVTEEHTRCHKSTGHIGGATG